MIDLGDAARAADWIVLISSCKNQSRILSSCVSVYQYLEFQNPNAMQVLTCLLQPEVVQSSLQPTGNNP